MNAVKVVATSASLLAPMCASTIRDSRANDAIAAHFGGPFFGFWMTRGTIALVLVTLVLTALWWADARRGR